MRAEIEATLAGKKVSLALPMGALEDISENIEPKVYHLTRRMASGDWTLPEVRGVLDVALKAGGSDVEVDDVIHQDGIMRAAEACYMILERALTGDTSKKAPAAGKKKSRKPDS